MVAQNCWRYNSFDFNIKGAAAQIPTVTVVLERFDNYFDSYIARLYNLAKTCSVGDERETNLRDQLVFRRHDDSLREKLFREETLILQSARQIATAHEAARQNINLFRGQTHDQPEKAGSPRHGNTES